MLPEIDGYELLEYIRPTETPVIFITAKGNLHDRVQGLRLGADDYIVKPFQISELTARVDALLRRMGKSVTQFSLFGVEINTESRIVTKDGIPIDLTLKEFDLLVELIRNKMSPSTATVCMKRYGTSRSPARHGRWIPIFNDCAKSLIGTNTSKPYSASATGWRCRKD